MTLLALSAALFASGLLYLLLLNRVVLHIPDGRAKLSSAVLLLALALGAPFLLAFQAPTPWVFALCGVVLGGGALAELSRLTRRRRYWAEGLVGSPDPPGVVTTTTVTVSRYRLPVPGLAMDRLRIVHLSDVHADSRFPKDYLEDVAREAMALGPDLVVITGDFVSHASYLGVLPGFLGALEAPLGVHAIMGNHDHWAGGEALRAMLDAHGIRLLGGRWEELQLGGRPVLRIGGCEAPWGPRLPPPVSAGPPRLVLTHTPDNAARLAHPDTMLILAGHTHAGQIRLPLVGPLVMPTHTGRLFDRGIFRLGDTFLVVNSGLGAAGVPIRLWCPAEIGVIDLLGDEKSWEAVR